MSQLIDHMSEYVKQEMLAHIDGSREPMLRAAFSGPPREMLDELFMFLTREHGEMRLMTLTGEVTVPVYLVDPKADDPNIGSNAARCTASHLVKIRTGRHSNVFLALHEVGEAINDSLCGTQQPIGITRFTDDFDDWLDLPLVSALLHKALRTLFQSSPPERAMGGVRVALQEAWEADERHQDRRNVWTVMRRLSDHQSTTHPAISLSVVLGLPNCNPESMGSKEHLNIPNRLVEYFDSNGLMSGFDMLAERASDELRQAVLDFRAHIASRCLDASDFARRPMYFYSPKKDANNHAIPNWWKQLTIDAWSELLDPDDPNGETGRLSVVVTQPMSPPVRGLPTVVAEAVSFEISLADAKPTEAVNVVLSRSSGAARLQHLDDVLVELPAPTMYEDADVPQHDRFVRYVFESPISDKRHVEKVIVLNQYNPGIVVTSRSASKVSPFKLNKKAKDEVGRPIQRYEGELRLSGMGSHQLDIYTATGITLSPIAKGYEIDAEQDEEVNRPINMANNNHAVCLVETDEQCYYEFEASRDGRDAITYRVILRADEMSPVGANSEFDRLLIEHRAAARKERPNPRVEPTNSRVLNLEEWALNDAESFRPIAFGPDYLSKWRKPDWPSHSVFSGYSMPLDPRPSAESFLPPEDFLHARRKLLDQLSGKPDEPVPIISTLRLHDYMRVPAFQEAIVDFLVAYAKWLQADYESAAWTDVISLHARQSNSDSLESNPYAIILTPFHPVRLAWQCRAQEVLESALEAHERCPAASILNPSACPDCMILPCKTATGIFKTKRFAAITCSSDYWGVLWSLDHLDRLGTKAPAQVFTPEFGISIDGLSQGFTAPQVVRAMDEVSRLLPARATLRLSVTSDTTGASSCNEGIENWCVANLGPDADYWYKSGQRSLIVTDRRDEVLQPEQAALASLTARTAAAVRWFTRSDSDTEISDLAVVAHLGTMSHDVAVQDMRSVIDPSGITRWRVRKQLAAMGGKFIAESRIGSVPTSLENSVVVPHMLECIDLLERRCRDEFDSYVFAPNMAVLEQSISTSRYCVVSDSNVDAACFFGVTEDLYLWDYELPSYARRAGENGGYFLLASQSSSMNLAVRSALRQIGDDSQISDEDIQQLLVEISRRGMPTLKRLTAGGSASFGEVGMLVALRLLQSEFRSHAQQQALLPVLDSDESINLLVPADPFQNHFEDLRVALEDKHGGRPDLLVLSARFNSGDAKALRITPIEIKARSQGMQTQALADALAQASDFALFLAHVQDKADDSELWSIAWRGLIAALLDYGFRVYGQLEQFMQQHDWAMRQSSLLFALANRELDVQVDRSGRLVVMDHTYASDTRDLDQDRFTETIALSHADAFSLLRDCECPVLHAVRQQLSDWRLKPLFEQEAEEVVAGEVSSDVVHTPNLEKDQHLVGEDGEDEHGNETSSEGEVDDRLVVEGREGNEASPEEKSVKGMKFPVGQVVQALGQSVVDFYPGNTALNQLNVGIVGDLGTGKTQLVQALIYRMRECPAENRGRRPNVLIFDYKKDYSKDSFVAATGATVLSPFDLPINLFDTTGCTSSQNAWLERTKFFTDVLDKIYAGIGPNQRFNLKKAIKSSYENARSWGRAHPTIYDVYDIYCEQNSDKADSPMAIMSDIVDGGYFVQEQKKVRSFGDLLNGVVVVDLAAIGQDDRTKNVLVVILLNLFYEHMLRIEKEPFLGSNPSTRFIDTMLLVDEADNIMQYEFDVLKKILLQGREFGVGVLLASQYLSHFRTPHENYMEPLLTWFVHKVPDIKVKELEAIGLTGVSADTVDKIKSLQCHECLFKTLDVPGVVIKATPFFEILQERNTATN